jgi:hypothetical protein
MSSASMPALVRSQEMTELQVHISPAWSSSRPQVRVGTHGKSVKIRAVVAGSRVIGTGLLTA